MLPPTVNKSHATGVLESLFRVSNALEMKAIVLQLSQNVVTSLIEVSMYRGCGRVTKRIFHMEC